MPLRQDGSGGTRSARPPTSIPPERTSSSTELDGGVRPCKLRDVLQNELAFEALEGAGPRAAEREPGALLEDLTREELRPHARRVVPDAEIEPIDELTRVNPFVAVSRA